jgi:hypothetical protein
MEQDEKAIEAQVLPVSAIRGPISSHPGGQLMDRVCGWVFGRFLKACHLTMID